MVSYILALAVAATQPALPSQDLQEINAVTKRFLSAMVLGDRETLRGLVPRQTQNRYGPCPLGGMPAFTRIVVDLHKAGIYFTGGHKDPQLPQKGLFVMTRVDEDTEWPWKVRTVVWYEDVPRSVRLPSSSVTKNDVAQEPEVRRSAMAFIRAWRKPDSAFLERISYRWVDKRKPKRSRKISVKRVTLTAFPAANGEARVNFSAKLQVLGFLPYRLNGTLQVVKEEGEWKVRENSFAF